VRKKSIFEVGGKMIMYRVESMKRSDALWEVICKGYIDDFPLINSAQSLQVIGDVLLCNSNNGRLFITVTSFLVIFWSVFFSILIGLFMRSNFMFLRIVGLLVRKIGEVT